MKQLFFSLIALVMIIQVTQAQKKVKMKSDNMKVKTKVAAATTAANMMMPYVAEYSSNFRMGNQQHAKMILELRKDYDDNDLDRHADWFADTVTMV